MNELLQGLRVWIELLLLIGGTIAAVAAATPRGIQRFKRAWGFLCEWATDWRLQKVERDVAQIKDQKGEPAP